MKLHVEKTPERLLVKMGDKNIFWGEAFQGQAIPYVCDVHGHYKIRERIRKVKKLNAKFIKLLFENPVTLEFQGSRDTNRLIIQLGAFPEEHIFGGGEQYTYLNLKGKWLPLFVQEQGVGRGWNLISLLTSFRGIRGHWYSTYFPQPVFFSSIGYGIIVDTDAVVIADFTKKENTTLEVWSNYCRLIFLEGDLKNMVQQFHRLYSTKLQIPDWVFGVWLASQGGVKEADRVISIARKWGIPISALWCQDWCGKKITKFGRQVYWNWSYDQNDYSNLPQHIQRWKEEGVRFLGYVNPFLIKNGELYKIAKNMGFLVKKPNGEVYDIVVTHFPAGLVDLSNPEAYQWYKEIIKENMIRIGMAGWMADYGEYLPADAYLANGKGLDYHNRYVIEWAKLNADAIQETKSDAIFFMRAGYLGSTRYAPIYWTGDQNVDWSKTDGLPSVIPALISSGLCGVKLSHCDLGGFTSLYWVKRSAELFMRWTELSAFSPIMRTHQTNRPYCNIQFDSSVEILQHFSTMSRIHYGLKDYLCFEVKNSFLSGLPLVRHLALHYPEDPVVWDIQYEYLLGRDVLVAPVIKPGLKKWRCYLPNDYWIHLFSGREYRKGWTEIKADLGQPPVFIRADSDFAQYLIELVKEESRV